MTPFNLIYDFDKTERKVTSWYVLEEKTILLIKE